MSSDPISTAPATKIVTFGEIMARLAPPGFLRCAQAMPGSPDVTFAGAEASVASLGGSASFVTALPANALGDACIANLRATPGELTTRTLREFLPLVTPLAGIPSPLSP